MDAIFYKLRFLLAGVAILTCLALLLLLLLATVNAVSSEFGKNKQPEQRASAPAASTFDSPNVITNGMNTLMDRIARAVDSTGSAISGAGSSVVAGMAQGGTSVGKAVGGGATFAVQCVGKGMGLIINSGSTTFAFISGGPTVSALIKPSEDAKVPKIESYPATVLAAQALETVTAKQQSPAEPKPTWPIQGRVTTLFGVPHWPYQTTHTGIDIASGKPSGVTPIKPYAPGRVAETIHSSRGLGNHVIVDHGGGITSVYAHLYSISVKTGQKVTKNTTLGHEGSTGVSTGTHLHFEIRKNGQPTNPQKYIHGHP